MSERKIVQSRSAFATTVNGRTVMVAAGDVYYSDDPLVKGREGLFGEVVVNSSRPAPPASTAAVETASAAPGSRRAVTKPPARAGKSSEEGKTDA